MGWCPPSAQSNSTSRIRSRRSRFGCRCGGSTCLGKRKRENQDEREAQAFVLEGRCEKAERRDGREESDEREIGDRRWTATSKPACEGQVRGDEKDEKEQAERSELGREGHRRIQNEVGQRTPVVRHPVESGTGAGSEDRMRLERVERDPALLDPIVVARIFFRVCRDGDEGQSLIELLG